MSFKTILAIIQSADDVRRVTGCAAGLAARFDSHVIGLHSEALPVPYTSAIGFPDADFIQASSEASRQRSREIELLFGSKAAEAGISSEWRSIESFSGDSAHGGIATARCSDLIIASQVPPGSQSASSPDVDALLFEAGRPLLITPSEGPCLSSFRRVIVAWNGSREAARATFDALPLILEAVGTEILIIDPPERPDQPQAGVDIAAALARHGAEVSVHAAKSKGLSTDAVIRNRLADTGADLLVLGAYSHSWLRQLIFGGVTRTVLQSMPVTAFLSR